MQLLFKGGHQGAASIQIKHSSSIWTYPDKYTVFPEIIVAYGPYTVNKRMCLSLLVVRKYVPIRWCVLNREWNFGPTHCQYVRALDRSSTWPASYELSNSWEALVYKSWNYDWRSSLAENPWKIIVRSWVHETHFKESDRPHPKRTSWCWV